MIVSAFALLRYVFTELLPSNGFTRHSRILFCAVQPINCSIFIDHSFIETISLATDRVFN
jgi:hypothetical protein